jgi:hypothetical protein
MDRSLVSCAQLLEEAWAWGFDVDVWRAHLNAITWPEVLRECAIAAGAATGAGALSIYQWPVRRLQRNWLGTL